MLEEMAVVKQHESTPSGLYFSLLLCTSCEGPAVTRPRPRPALSRPRPIPRPANETYNKYKFLTIEKVLSFHQ